MSKIKPTWENQLRDARKLLREQGFAELNRHAQVCVHNRCKCVTGLRFKPRSERSFCCAALVIVRAVQ